MTYTRQWVEAQHDMHKTPVYAETDSDYLVNGALQRSQLWVSKNDQSVTPCLTGEVGSRPGMWEAWIVAWHMNHFKDYDVYVDLGANTGYYSVLAAQQGLITYAVEAQARYCQLMSRSLLLNNLSGLVTVNCCAVADSPQFVSLVKTPGQDGGTYIAPATDAQEKVWATTLDDLVPESKYRMLIKMDIEGAEERAFAGAEKVNARNKPDYIIEYTSGAYSDSFFDRLAEYGEVFVVDYEGEENVITKEEANSCEDWITLVIRHKE